MTNEQLSKKSSLALDHFRKANSIVSICAKQIAKDKGFKNWMMFDASLTPSGETIINFDQYGSFADMDLELMIVSSKEQIINSLSRWDIADKCEGETLKLLKE